MCEIDCWYRGQKYQCTIGIHVQIFFYFIHNIQFLFLFVFQTVFSSDSGEFKMVFVVRNDLKMGKGKAAAQVHVV